MRVRGEVSHEGGESDGEAGWQKVVEAALNLGRWLLALPGERRSWLTTRLPCCWLQSIVILARLNAMCADENQTKLSG